MNKPVRIITSGLGWSGSSAVVDLLKEYKGIQQMPGGFIYTDTDKSRILGEFDFFRNFGGIGDRIVTDKKINYPSTLNDQISIISSFPRFAYSLLRGIFVGRKFEIWDDIKTYRQLRMVADSLKKLEEDFKQCENQQDSLQLALQWVDNIIANSYKEIPEAVIFDQAINIGQHDNLWPIVFEPYRLIIVFRDPRDQFTNQNSLNIFVSRQTIEIGRVWGWEFEEMIKFRVKFTLNIIKSIDILLEKEDQNPNILLISFEELVLKYEESKMKIEEFLGIKNLEHIHPKRYFNPEVSIKNIGVHKRSESAVDVAELTELVEWYDKTTSFMKLEELDRLKL